MLNFDLLPLTVRRWFKEYNFLGTNATRRTRKLSSRLGRPTKISIDDLMGLIDFYKAKRDLLPED